MRRDLNVAVAKGKSWEIPFFWGPVIRYISAPILAIIVGFAYPAFYLKRNDPLHIFAFSVAHVVMILVTLGLIVPRSLDIFVPPARRIPDDLTYAPNVTIGVIQSSDSREDGTKPDHSEVENVDAKGQ